MTGTAMTVAVTPQFPELVQYPGRGSDAVTVTTSRPQPAGAASAPPTWTVTVIGDQRPAGGGPDLAGQ